MLQDYSFPCFYNRTEMLMIGSHYGILAFVTIGLLCLNKLVAGQSMLSLTGVVCPPCTDVKPPGPYTCSQQREFGKCKAPWMKNQQYCMKTCGACDPCNKRPQPPSRVFTPPPAPPTPPQPPPNPNAEADFGTCKCSDIPPSLEYTCAEQRDFGKCNAVWMVETSKLAEGFCETTCGRCQCPGSPKLPAPVVPKLFPTENCVCTDEIPPGTTLTCEQQRAFGKCFSVWMLDTSDRKEGYCQITCNRCPCDRKLPGETEISMPVSLPGLEGPVLNGNSTTLQSPPAYQMSGPVSFDSPELINGLPSGARAIVLRNPNGPPVVLIVSPPSPPSANSSTSNKEPKPEPAIPAVPPKQPEPKKPSKPKPRITPIRPPTPSPEPSRIATPSPAPEPKETAPLPQPAKPPGQPAVITSPPATVRPLIPPRPRNETEGPEAVGPVSVPQPAKPALAGQPAVITSPPATVQPLIPSRPQSDLGLPVVPVIVVDLEDFPSFPKDKHTPVAEPTAEPDAEERVGIALGIDPAEEPGMAPMFELPMTDSIDLDEELGREPSLEAPMTDPGVVDLDEVPAEEPKPELIDEMDGLFSVAPLGEPAGELDLDEFLGGVPSVEPVDELFDCGDELEERMLSMEPVPEAEEDSLGIFIQGEELDVQPMEEPLDEPIDEILDDFFESPIEEPSDETVKLDEDLEDTLLSDGGMFFEVPAPDDEGPMDSLEEILDENFEDMRGSGPMEEPSIETVSDLMINREPEGGLEPPSQEPVEEMLDAEYLDDLEEAFFGELEAYPPEEEPPVEEPQKIDFFETPMVDLAQKNDGEDLEEMDKLPLEEPTGEPLQEPIPEADIEDVQRPVRRLPENCTSTADMLASNPNLTMLTRLMTVGGLLGRSGGLQFQGTLFAPNDEAITAALRVLGIGFDELLDLSEILQGLLSFLLVDEILFEEDLTNGLEVNPRLEGVDPLVILRSDFRMEGQTESIIVVVGSRDTARIVDSGIRSCDVAIHVIDEFLLPSLEATEDSPGIPGIGEIGGGVASNEDDPPTIEGYVTVLEDVLDTEDTLNKEGNGANAKLPAAANEREAGLEGFANRILVDR